MATTATAYRETRDLRSVNFDASSLPWRYAWTLKHFVKESHYGPDLWASTFRASHAAGVSYKTMQRHLDWLERKKILHKKHSANEFIPGKGLRRSATYVFNGSSSKWLAPRETYPQWQRRNRRQAPPHKRPHRTSHFSPSSEVGKQEVPAAKPALVRPDAPQQPIVTQISFRLTAAARLMMDMCGVPDISGTQTYVEAAIVAEAKFTGTEIEQAAKSLAEYVCRDQKAGVKISRFYFRDAQWRSYAGTRSASSQRSERSKANIIEGLRQYREQRDGGSNARGPDAFDGPERKE
jgi:hypothetical protein